jgi:hypothetical protein
MTSMPSLRIDAPQLREQVSPHGWWKHGPGNDPALVHLATSLGEMGVAGDPDAVAVADQLDQNAGQEHVVHRDRLSNGRFVGLAHIEAVP